MGSAGCRWDDALRVAYFARFRYHKQIVSGVQPFEFVRASSVHYLTFNTKGFTRLAALAETLGVDVWRSGLRHGRALKDAWDFALPHVLTRVAHWPWKQARACACALPSLPMDPVKPTQRCAACHQRA